MSVIVIMDKKRPSCAVLQFGVLLWLINPPNGVLMYLFSNHWSKTWEIPNVVDFFIGSTANNPNPSTDDDFMVRYDGRGRYI